MRPARVAIAEAALRAFERAAAAAWPREAVAVLGGHDRGDTVEVTAVVPIDGAGADDGFAVPPAAFARAEAALRAAGAAWRGFAHSHPRGAAAPSRRDRRELWRGCVQVIVGGTSPAHGPGGAFGSGGPAAPPLPLAVGPAAQHPPEAGR